MQKNGFRNVILCALTVLFLGTGIWLLNQRLDRKNEYLDAVHQAEYAAENPDRSALEALEAERNGLLAETEEMNEQMLTIQEEITSLEQELVQLQQEYDQLAQEEDSVYYQTIFQSLTEGVSLVESYLNGDQ